MRDMDLGCAAAKWKMDGLNIEQQFLIARLIVDTACSENRRHDEGTHGAHPLASSPIELAVLPVT
jgi:hypothetical protein